nr:UDP-N-acetylglucosamine 2-epimerase (non-hydrolyzing) [Micromonospora sp. DSM 115978]
MPPPLKVMVLYGTRPEAIKLAPLIRALHQDESCEPIVVTTGQHRSLLRSANVPVEPRVALEFSVIREGQSLASLTANTLGVATRAVEQTRPDVVVVHGDTTTALAGALAAYYRRRPVVHVEAGLRTADRYSPFPEEMNRRLITQIAELHLAPTPAARENLLAAGVSGGDIAVTGNLVVDALFAALGRPPRFAEPRLARAMRQDRPIVLFTMHRRESWGEQMALLAAAVRTFCRAEPDVTLVVPMHPNPTVRAALRAGLGELDSAIVCDPLGYDEFIHLMNRTTVVVTDSGGIQEEAVTLGRTVLVVRDDTERPEGVAEGLMHVVGRDPQRVVAALHRVFGPARDEPRGRPSLVYGDGKAAQRSLSAITARWCGGARIADVSAVA